LTDSSRIGGEPGLLVDTVAATNVAAVGVWFDRGSRDEAAGEYGSTHFIEHMLFKGTSSRNALDISREIDRLGGSINAFTDRECMALHAVVPEEGLPAACEIFRDVIHDSLFDNEEFLKERSVIENEITAADDDPEEFAADALLRRLWGDEGVARKIGGESAELRALGRDQVNSLYDEHIRGGTRLVSIAGKIEDGKAADLLASWPASPHPPAIRRLPAAPRLESGGESFRSAPFQHVQVFYTTQLESRIDERDYYVLQVANAAVGESMSSRLFQELRENRGLCYSVFTAATLLADRSAWTAFATSSSENAGKLAVALREELSRLLEDGLTETEVADARSHVRGSLLIASADMEYRMRRIARRKLYGYGELSCEEAAGAVSDVSADKVNALLRRFLSTSPVLFGVGPKEARRAFLRAAEA